MKPIKNLCGFVQSLRRSNLFGKIEVVDGVVYVRRCRDYFITRDILRHDYLDTHRVSYLEMLRSDENIVIRVKFY